MNKLMLVVIIYSYLFIVLYKYKFWFEFNGFDKLVPEWRVSYKPYVYFAVWGTVMSLDFFVTLTVFACLDKIHTPIFSNALKILCAFTVVKFLLSGVLESSFINKHYKSIESISLFVFYSRLYRSYRYEQFCKERFEEGEIQKEIGGGLDNKRRETYEEQAERLKSLLPSGVEWQDAPPQSDVDNDC